MQSNRGKRDADEEQTKPNRTNFLSQKYPKKTKAWNHLNESESEMHCYLS